MSVLMKQITNEQLTQEGMGKLSTDMANDELIQRREQYRLRRRNWLSNLTEKELLHYRERCRQNERCRRHLRRKRWQSQVEHERRAELEQHKQQCGICQRIRLTCMTKEQLAECRERRLFRLRQRRQQGNKRPMQLEIQSEDQRQQPHNEEPQGGIVHSPTSVQNSVNSISQESNSSRKEEDQSRRLDGCTKEEQLGERRHQQLNRRRQQERERLLTPSSAGDHQPQQTDEKSQSSDMSKLCQGFRSSRMTEVQLAECRERRRQRINIRRRQEKERRLKHSRIGRQQLQVDLNKDSLEQPH